MDKISIVIPCYKSSMTIEKVVSLTEKQLAGYDLEFVLVNDASPDDGATISVLKKLAEKDANVTVIDLAKNAGQHNAVLAGLNYTSGEYILSLDDDMQTHPSQIPLLMEEMKKGYDIVYAYYPEKKHGFIRNLGSRFNSWSVRVLIGKPKELKTSSFWIIKRFVRDYVIQYQNPNSYLQGLFLRTTRNIKSIPVQHFEREYGKSNYNMKALLRLWSNILGFSVVPLRIASFIGAAFSLLSIILAIVIFFRRIFFNVSIAGWASTMVSITFFSGLILMFMGLIGEYIGRMFLANNREPQFVVREIIQQKDLGQ